MRPTFMSRTLRRYNYGPGEASSFHRLQNFVRPILAVPHYHFRARLTREEKLPKDIYVRYLHQGITADSAAYPRFE